MRWLPRSARRHWLSGRWDRSTRSRATVAGACRISGRATSAATPLPGVTVTVQTDGAVKGATSTDPDGTYHVHPAARNVSSVRRADRLWQVRAGRHGRRRCVRADRRRPARARATRAGRGSRSPVLRRRQPPRRALRSRPASVPRGNAGGRGAAPGQGAAAGRGQRFETLAVQTQSAAAASLEVNPPERESEAAALLLPPGFSTEGPTQAVAINGNMASVDRGMMGDRPRGDRPRRVRSGDRRVRAGLRPRRPGRIRRPRRPRRSAAGLAGGAAPAAVAVPADRAARAGAAVPAGFALGGRGGRQNAYTFTSNYTFGGSVLDSAPYQLHDGLPGHAEAVHAPDLRRHGRRTGEDQARLRRHAPHQLHALLQRHARRRTCSISTRRCRPTRCAAATSPRAASRSINPATGQPFAGNQIPAVAHQPDRARAPAVHPACPIWPARAATSTTSRRPARANDNVNLRRDAQLHAGRRRPRRTRRTPAAAAGAAASAGAGRARRPRRAAGHQRQHDGAAPVPPQRQRSDQHLPDARRRHHRLEPVRPGHAQHRAQADHAQRRRELLAGPSRRAQSLRLRQRRRRATRGSPACRPIRSTGACRSCPSPRLQPARRHAVAPHRLAADARVWLDASVDEAHACVPAGTCVSTTASAGPTPTRTARSCSPGCIRPAGSPVHGGGLDFADFLLGLPQQAALQYGPGNEQAPRQVDEPVSAGRLAQERRS